MEKKQRSTEYFSPIQKKKMSNKKETSYKQTVTNVYKQMKNDGRNGIGTYDEFKKILLNALDDEKTKEFEEVFNMPIMKEIDQNMQLSSDLELIYKFFKDVNID